MPSLEDLRRWLRGASLPGAPDARRRAPEAAHGSTSRPGGVDAEKMARNRKDHRYTVSMDGADAVLNFGKHKGLRISDLAKTDEGRSYMLWLLKEGMGFGEDLLGIIRHVDGVSE